MRNKDITHLRRIVKKRQAKELVWGEDCWGLYDDDGRVIGSEEFGYNSMRKLVKVLAENAGLEFDEP